MGWTSKILTGFFLLLCATVGGGSSLAEYQGEGRIKTETRLELLTRLFAPSLAEKNSDWTREQGHCGVAIGAMVQDSWSRMTPEIRQHIPDLFRPPMYRTFEPKDFPGIEVCDAHLDSEHFRIHYSTQFEHVPPGYPDLQAVHDLAANLETAYAFHRDFSGMGVALPDGDHGGGLDLVDCYFYDLEDVWGLAFAEENVGAPCQSSRWGYMAVSTDFGSYDFSDQLKLTSEHEYYHLLQYARNPHQYSWFKESTARNSEFHVWPDIATPRGAWAWMTQPYLSLWDASGIHQYAPHFWFYLEAHFGGDFVTRIWDRCCYTREEIALAEELASLGTDLDAILTDFAIWNYFTGERADGEHYYPGCGLPAVHHQAGHRVFPVSAVAVPEDQIARAGGSNYLRFFGPASQNNLRLTLDGHPDLAGQRSVTVLGVGNWGHRSWVLEPDSNGDLEFIVPDWGLYDYVTLVVSNFWNAPRDPSTLYYTYAAEEIAHSARPSDTARLVMSSPNPFSGSTRVVFYTPDSGSGSIVRIHDLAGRLVRTLRDDAGYTGLHQVVWDGLDENGRPSPAGIYLLRLDSGSDQHVSKVMYLR